MHWYEYRDLQRNYHLFSIAYLTNTSIIYYTHNKTNPHMNKIIKTIFFTLCSVLLLITNPSYAQKFGAVGTIVDPVSHEIIISDRNQEVHIPLDYHAIKDSLHISPTPSETVRGMIYQQGSMIIKIYFSYYDNSGFTIHYSNPSAWVTDSFILDNSDFSKSDADLIETYIKSLYLNLKE